MRAIEEGGAVLLTIDSEHNAIQQCLPPTYDRVPGRAGVRRLLLTASGGPFRTCALAGLPHVSPDEACAHPNWRMGRKISVDSATMMNKGLEVIEAHWLFGVPAAAIKVVIHPQSVIHSLVEYVDGSVLAELGHPDMRTPIAQALAHPERIESGVPPLELAQLAGLTFEEPDIARFPGITSRVRGSGSGRDGAGDPECGQRGRGGRVPRSRGPVHRYRGNLRGNACPPAGAAVGIVRRCARRRRRGASDCHVAARPRAGKCENGFMIDLSYKIVAFLVTLGVLVVFHELGHYLVARWCGVKVLRFSVGFGRIVASRRVGPDQTEWALSAIPLGGYVKMADEREGDVAPADLDRAFNRQNVWKRIAIVAAGPIANLLLAVVLYAGTYMAGIPGQRALLAEPSAATAAAAAGLRGGDLVVALDGVAVHSWQDLRWRLLRAQDRGNVDVAVLPKDARADDAPVVRRLSLQGVKAADWEGNAISMLGLRPDLGAPLIGEVVTGKPAAAAGLEKGDRILAIDGVQMHSPGDVAQATNASAGTPLTFRVERGGSARSTSR